MISWKALEENVKTIASLKWNCNAINETINGVKFDCVLKIKPDYWIIVEVSENHTLEKVRTDIAKFATCKQYLFTQYKYSECFIVLREEPTESMQTTAQGCNVTVLSFNSFSKYFFNYDSYFHVRSAKTFGSSVNPVSGSPDLYKYTPVHYENIETKKQVSIDELSKFLSDGKRIILIGNYGTGKSRCVRELFFNISQKRRDKVIFPISINLKENWGTQRADEIINRHLGILGLSDNVDSLIKILNSDKFVFLLDGFDEIGAQGWSEDSSKLKQIRASSLSAVKDLIQLTKSPVIITGREHYFNSNDEMFQLLGLKQDDTIVLRCKDEFTEDEMEEYLKNLSKAIELPFWLPRRPLICQIINNLESDKIEEIFLDSFSAVEFWNTLIKNICERESKINPILDSNIIFKILKKISNETRTKSEDVGPISITEINKAFEEIVGTQPVDESAVMLQRLPGLGRFSSESHDRQFIDYYILDGLRADNLIDIVYENQVQVFNDKWINTLSKIGIEIVAKKIKNDRSANTFIGFLKLSANSKNNVLTGDLLAILTYYTASNAIDLGGLNLKIKTSLLYFSNSLLDNLIISDSEIDELDISNCSFSRIYFKGCIINKIYGISSENELPPYISDCLIEHYDINSINYKNRLFNLKPSQMILLSLLKKFFVVSPGVKLESELVKNFGNPNDRIIVLEVLKVMCKEKVISKSTNGQIGYSTKSNQRSRVLRIISEKEKSNDNLWLEVGNFPVKI